MKDYSKIDSEIKKINLLYKFNEGFCISFIVTDNNEIKKYLKEGILSIDTETILDEKIVNYDFYENRNSTLKDYRELCEKKGNLVIATGIGDFSEYLVDKGKINNAGEAYFNIFNLPRDDFYLEKKVRLVLLVNYSEYDMFLSNYCDDFTSYAVYTAHIDEELEMVKDTQTMDER